MFLGSLCSTPTPLSHTPMSASGAPDTPSKSFVAQFLTFKVKH
ncbi:hypothetical protein HMPREF9004_1764 [Schaalia cardiffensis F0333]|uniref:Uncharacterized protein n=1 Tax=Schaalia cardiffensis F0333 TaxID=888050 RepID=N6WC96_9ACTO|nr:hypothetical protein HMPREF9004_1764 [Schaalia cardiffensis F0333]